MDTATLYPAVAFAAGLALTWSLCAWLTPRAWWRRPNLRALALSAAGAWGFGSMILAAVPVAAVPVAAVPVAAVPVAALPVAAVPATAIPGAAVSGATVAATTAAPGKAAPPTAARGATTPGASAGSRTAPTGDTGSGSTFQVHRDLNLRAGASVDAPRLLTVPAGATVLATGRRHGDWWQVTASVNGHPSTGWASSLWLRRSAEQRRPPR